MRIGLIDVDGHNYPNLPLMKLSAWHKQKNDLVEWYEPFKGLLDEYDIVYMSKIFHFRQITNNLYMQKKYIRVGAVIA